MKACEFPNKKIKMETFTFSKSICHSPSVCLLHCCVVEVTVVTVTVCPPDRVKVDFNPENSLHPHDWQSGQLANHRLCCLSVWKGSSLSLWSQHKADNSNENRIEPESCCFLNPAIISGVIRVSRRHETPNWFEQTLFKPSDKVKVFTSDCDHRRRVAWRQFRVFLVVFPF